MHQADFTVFGHGGWCLHIGDGVGWDAVYDLRCAVLCGGSAGWGAQPPSSASLVDTDAKESIPLLAVAEYLICTPYGLCDPV
jgi:hypothetical protein